MQTIEGLKVWQESGMRLVGVKALSLFANLNKLIAGRRIAELLPAWLYIQRQLLALHCFVANAARKEWLRLFQLMNPRGHECPLYVTQPFLISGSFFGNPGATCPQQPITAKKIGLRPPRLWTSHCISTGPVVQNDVYWRQLVFSPPSVPARYNPCPARL